MIVEPAGGEGLGAWFRGSRGSTSRRSGGSNAEWGMRNGVIGHLAAPFPIQHSPFVSAPAAR
ncbi:hypothetical protein PLANPX_4690 [Lacipirellula parvula]|uniref:Uncharacterized protein n=1 Tax=Lacipirellula parvula TaxID=2650471 RepID=A0A5K7XF03_9BACT|nr:hypothetical protein PLANPX_4690 [Lacipirellula parvula]